MEQIKSSLIVLSFLLFGAGFAQKTQPTAIQNGMNISSEISSGETHRYKFLLEEGKFAFFKLMQQGVNVKITTFDPEGKKLTDFNGRNGKSGIESVNVSSDKEGEYVLEVSPVDEKESKGKYLLSFEKLQSKAVSAEGQVDELFIPWDSEETPGAAVAVVKDGKIIYKNGYGMANLEYDIPITPASVFHIASVSKQFTVFSILLLEKEGKLSLEDDIRKFIPEVPDFGKTITLKHLASHTSGLRDQWNLLAMAGWRLDDVITKEHVLKLVRNQKELNFDPGEEYVYCNTGFTLLAEVASRVSGKSFAEFTRERIFEPLNMSNTLFYDDHEKIVKNRAYSYSPDSTGYKKSVLNYANVGATSLFTTVEDLSLWAMNFSDPKVGDQEILNKMNTPAVLNNGETFGGALGQFVGKYKGLNEIQHGGADAGYRSYLTRFPEQDFSVIVFSNDGSFSSGSMAHKVADIYLKDQIRSEEPLASTVEEVKDESIVVDQKTLATYEGEFELQPGFILNVSTNNGRLYGKPSGQPSRLLKAITKDEFMVDGVEAKITFIPNASGKVDLLKLEQGGQTLDGTRVKPFDKSGVDLQEFTGHFYSEELTTGYSLVIEDDKLVARHSRLSDMKLEPVKENSFMSDAWFFREIKFTRDAENAVNGFKVSSGRVRDLVFQKQL